MAYEKQVQKKFTVAGIASWPNTHTPRKWDNRNRVFIEAEDGDYTCDVLVNEDYAKDIEAQLKAVIADNPGICPKQPNIPVEQEVDKASGEPTGKWKIKTKQKAMSMGRPKKVLHVDARTQPITDPNFRLTGGSDIIVACHTYVHPMGISLFIDGIQVVELAEDGYFDVSSAFEKKDGFVAAPEMEDADTANPFVSG